MPVAARSKLCSRVSAWLGIFASMAMWSAESASVIVMLGWTRFPQKYGKPDNSTTYCNAVYNQNPIDRWMKGCILPFPKNGDLGLAKNYRGITLISIAAKIYDALLGNRIEPKINNILRKKQNGFRRNRSTTSQILTIRRILEGVQATLPRPSIPFTKGWWNKSY